MAKEDIPSGQVKKKGGNSAIKIAGVISAIVIIVGGVFFLKKNTHPVTSLAPTPPVNKEAVNVGIPKSPLVKENIDIYNKEKASSQARTRKTFIPQMNGTSDIVTPDTNKVSPPPLVSQNIRRGKVEDEEWGDEYKEFIDVMLPQWRQKPQSATVLVADQNNMYGVPTAKAVKTSLNSSSSDTGANSKNSKTVSNKKRYKIPAGTILYGVTINELNSDNPSVVLAEITGGKYDGSELLGHFTRNGDYMAITFDKIVYKKDKTEDSIQAIAVRPDQKMDSNLATAYNNHVLYRYGMLLGSGFLMGIGNAAMYAGSAVSMSPYGTPYQMFGASNMSTDLMYGLGMSAQSLQGVAQQAFNTPPTVKVAAGTRLGILFVGGSGSMIPASGAGPSQTPQYAQRGSYGQGGYGQGMMPGGMMPGGGMMGGGMPALPTMYGGGMAGMPQPPGIMPGGMP